MVLLRYFPRLAGARQRSQSHVLFVSTPLRTAMERHAPIAQRLMPMLVSKRLPLRCVSRVATVATHDDSCSPFLAALLPAAGAQATAIPR